MWDEDALRVEELLKQHLSASLQPSIYSQCTLPLQGYGFDSLMLGKIEGRRRRDDRG